MYLEPKTMPALRPRPPEVEAGCSAFIQSLIDLLGDAEGALDGNRLAARALIRSALSILEAERSRRGTAPAPLTGLSKGGLPPWHARRIKGHIEANLGDPILLEDLAAIVQVSVRHFCLAFKQSFGQSPHAYIVRQRIEKAQRLMLQTDDSLARIALDCGLADQAHLSKWFRRLTGVSPAVWRKERRAWSQIARGTVGETRALARA